MTDESLGLCVALMSLGWTLRNPLYQDSTVTLIAIKPDTRRVCVIRDDVDEAFAALGAKCRRADQERIDEWLRTEG